MPRFPSVEWFETAASILAASDAAHRLGTCDAQMGVQSGDDYYEVDFEAFDVTGVKQIDAARASELDFVLVQSPEAWKAMIADIQANGQATHDYTLNSLDLRSSEEFARGKDYHRRDAFYRFNQTFQEFFDTAAKFETSW